MCKRRESQEKHAKKANENKVDHWSNSKKEVLYEYCELPW